MPLDVARGYVVELADGIGGLFEFEPSSRPAWLTDLPERFCAEEADFDQLALELVQVLGRRGES